MTALLFSLTLATGLLAAASREDKIKTELMEADRAFFKAASEKGLEGWMSYMADDAVRVTKIGEKLVTGKDNVRQLDAQIFANPERKLVWNPVDAHGYADGKSGITSGRFKIVGKDDAGQEKIFSQGGYFTGWRKGADGSWKVILDGGTPDK